MSTAAERHQSDNKQDRSDGGDIERQNLYDQRGADIGTQHDGERGHQADEPSDEVVINAVGGTALEQRGKAEAGCEGAETVVQRLGQQ